MLWWMGFDRCVRTGNVEYGIHYSAQEAKVYMGMSADEGIDGEVVRKAGEGDDTADDPTDDDLLRRKVRSNRYCSLCACNSEYL
jgi:hypothetical protein